MNRKGFFCCLISIYLINFVAGDPIKRSSWDLIPCYTCSNNECDVVPSATTSCTSCVTVYNEYSVLRRGCYEDESSKCNSDTNCAQCFDSGCNRGHPNHKCVKCESKNDINCVDKSQTLHPTQCLVDSDLLDDYLCYVTWNETSGENERGCVSKLSDYQDCLRNTETCKMCTPAALGICNTFQFPEDRQKCIQCYSGFRDCPNQYKTNTIDKYSVSCKTVEDSCVVINRGSGQQWQTCASDMSESEKKYCTDNKSQCKFCNDNNNCNWNDKMDEGTVTPKPNLATFLNASNLILLISAIFIKLF